MALKDTDGDITIGTKVDTSDLNKGLNSITKSMKKFENSISKTKNLLLTIFSADVLINFGKAALKAASDLQEVQNVINVSFSKEGIELVEKFSKAAVETFGMSEFTAKKTAGAYAAMGTALGLVQNDAEEMAMQLTALSGDMASFWNLTQDETYTALASVYTGETETLKRYGIVLTEANLQQYLHTKGIDESIKKMDAATKTMVRYNYIIEQTSLYQNDFVRTQENWANQIRVLQERWNRLMIALGNGLITVLNPLLKMLNAILEKVITLVKTLGMVLQQVFNINVQDISKQGLDLVNQSISDSAEAETELGDAVEETNKKLKNSLAAFDEINVLAQQTASTSATSDTFGIEDLGLGVLEPYDLEATSKDVAEIKPPQSWIDFFTNLKELMSRSIEPLSRLKDQLIVLKDYTFKGLEGFYNYFLKPVGSWVLGEGLPRLVDILANGLQKIKWQTLVSAFNEIWESLTPFVVDILGEGLLWFFENVLVPLGVWALNNVVPPVLESIASIIEIITGVLSSLEPLASALFDYVLKPLAKTIGEAIVSVLEDISDILSAIGDWFTNHPIMAQTFETLLGVLLLVVGAFKTLNGIITLFSNGWTLVEGSATGIFKIFEFISTNITKLPGIIAAAVGAISSAVGFLLSPTGLIIAGITLVISLIVLIVTHIEEVKDVLSRIGEWFNTNVISPISDGFSKIIDGASSAFEGVTQKAREGLSRVVEIVSNNVQVIIAVFSPIVNLLSEIFDKISTVAKEKLDEIFNKVSWLRLTIEEIFGDLGEWVKENITTPITGIFKKFINGLIGFVENFINAFINGINSVVDRISESKLAEILGDVLNVDLSQKIPRISNVSLPRLASGAVIPPNKEFMAILGDQTSGNNIEAPEGLIRKIFNEEMSKYQQQATDVTVNFTGSMSQLIRVLNPEIKKENRRVGKNLITGGAD